MSVDRERIRRRLRHDLRSPLTVIAGRSEMLLEGVYGSVNEDQRRCVQAIVDAATRLQLELEAVADLFEALPTEPD